MLNIEKPIKNLGRGNFKNKKFCFVPSYNVLNLHTSYKVLQTTFEAAKNFHFLSAPPGSGKTYTALECSLKLAKKGAVCILCFPNKSLLDDKFSEILKIAQGNEDFKDVEIYTHSLNDSIENKTLLKCFIKGCCVILTLHDYFTIQGDFFKLSNLFYLARFFSVKTSIFIDEAHDFLNNFNETVPITHAFVDKYESHIVLNKSSNLQNKEDFMSYQISQPVYEYGEKAGSVLKFESPKTIHENQKKFTIFNPLQISSLIHEKPPEKVQINEEPEFNVEVLEGSSLEVEKRDLDTTKNVPIPFDLLKKEVYISDKPSYEGAYFEELPIFFSQSPEKHIKFQIECFEIFEQEINFKTILVLLQISSYDNLYNAFKKIIYSTKDKEKRKNMSNL